MRCPLPLKILPAAAAACLFIFVFGLARPAPAQTPDPVQMVKEAKALMGSGDLDAAEKKLIEAVAIGEEQKNATALQFGYSFLGKIYATKGNTPKAIESYEKAAAAFEGNAKTQSILYLTLGDLCFDSGKFRDAIGFYEKASAAFAAAGDTSRQAGISNSIALCHASLGEYAEAGKMYESLLADARAAGDATGTISILMNIGDLDRTQSRYEDALKNFSEALALAEKDSRDRQRVLILNSISLVHQLRADPDKAQEALDAAAAICEKTGDQASLAATLHQRGILMLFKGDANQAIDDYKKAAEIKQALGDPTLAGTLAEIGRAYYFKGNYSEARRYYNEALKSNPPADMQITVDNNLAMVYRMQGMLEYALESFRSALEKARALNLTWHISFLLNNIGVVQREMGELNDALKSHEEALALDHAAGAKSDELVDVNNIALVYKLKAEPAKALELLSPAAEGARKFASADDLLRTLVNLGDVYLLNSEPDSAIKDYEEAAAAAEKTENPERLWNALYGLGQAWEKKGDIDRAVEFYIKAVEVIESLRAGVGGGGEEKSYFLVDKVKVYARLIQLLYMQGKPADALKYLERMKARSLLDIIQKGQAEINKGLSPEEEKQEKALKAEVARASAAFSKALAEKGMDSPEARTAKEKLDAAKKNGDNFREKLYRDHPRLAFARGESKPIEPAEFQKILAPDEIAVAYMLGDETSYAWTIARDQIKMYDLKDTAEKIGFVVDKKLRKAIEDGAWQKAQERASAKLYETIIAPFEQDLEGKKTLGVLPDGRLYEIPFYILRDKNDAYLIDRLAIYYMPSLSVAAEMRREQAQLKNQDKVLAFGNPKFEGGKLVQLPGTEVEVQKIADVFGERAAVHFHEDAIEDHVKRFGQGYRIIHFATHGLLNNNNPLFSSVAMSQVKDQPDDGFLEAREIPGIQLDAELVIMSACESGRGKLRPGEGILGLTRSFFSAGVPSIIASMWEVNDQATSFMMREFYSKYPGMSGVEALRQAQLATRAEFGDNPNLWAPFVIMGFGVPIGGK